MNVQYEEDDVLRGHTGPVVCVDALSHDNGITLVSSSSDSTMKIWERSRSAAKFTLSQSESFNRGFVLSLSLVSLEGSLVLACGTEANKVEIFVKQVDKASRSHALGWFIIIIHMCSSSGFIHWLAMKIG